MADLVRYDAARAALMEAVRVDDVKAIRDRMVALQTYAAQAKDRELMAPATELRKRAEDRAGTLLREMAERGERARGGGDLRKELQPATLSSIGVTKTQSSRWQAFAALPSEIKEAKIKEAIKKAIAAIDGVSKRTRAEMREEDEARVTALQPTPGKFKTLIIDPPWDYEWLSVAGRASPGYATMTQEELLALDVLQWAEENCHLYLWTTNNFMTRAVELMAHWGFSHKTILTWVKPRWGLGSYFRNSTEHILFGVRGTLRTRSDGIATHFHAPLGEHSEKPEEFYEIVRSASYLPAGEGFQRKQRDGFMNLFSPSDASILAATQ
jgi:N6-adenosine-specific RNA methylase IME4